MNDASQVAADRSSEACLPEAALLEFLVGDWDSHGDSSARRHLDECTSCQRRLEAIAELDGPSHPQANGDSLSGIKRRIYGLFPDSGSRAAPANPSGPVPGTRIAGRYELLEQIGEGGMGIVCIADQTEPVRRRVALKIIKPGMDSRQVMSRFEGERQALAMMDHPNIARLFDAGTTDAGLPFFVMELVRGLPITDYCDQARLVTNKRLELFVSVCQAVQHAHQKGIIHRDLKPSNILVAPHDGAPAPKIIDFGVAKALHQRLGRHAVDTSILQMVGTPLYMSPEQAELSGLDIDTRSDVYSLGVLLYELLTGQTPFDRETFLKSGYDEMRRMLIEDEPPRPSHRLSTLEAAALSTLSQQRGIDRRQLATALRGELDWIVMKCLEKDRARRYESASSLAADVQRYLDHVPVEACPPSARYRFRKFARRNRAAMTTAVLVGLALLAGTAASTWQAIRAVRAEKDARARAFLAEGNSHEAIPLLAELVDLRKKTLGADADATIGTMNDLGMAYRAEGRIDEARKVMEALLKVREKIYREQKERLGADDPKTLASMAGLARAFHAEGHFEAPVALWEEEFQRRTNGRGIHDKETLASMDALAWACVAAGKFERAAALFKESIALRSDQLAPDHPAVLDGMHRLGVTQYLDGNLELAAATLSNVLQLRESTLGLEHDKSIETMSELGMAYQADGKLDLAASRFEEVVRRQKAKGNPGEISSMGSLGLNLLCRGKYDEAEPFVRECLARETKIRPDVWNRYVSMCLLAGVLKGQARKQQSSDPAAATRKLADAQTLLDEALEGLRARFYRWSAWNTIHMRDYIEPLIELFTWDRPEDAAKWRALLPPGRPPAP